MVHLSEGLGEEKGAQARPTSKLHRPSHLHSQFLHHNLDIVQQELSLVGKELLGQDLIKELL